MRKLLEDRLGELRDEALRMGSMVEQQLTLALRALRETDADLGRQVIDGDGAVNEQRFLIEERCVELIATQQPAARDLRAIVAVMNMIVDLERIGDQAKGIAKLIPRLEEHPRWAQMPELQEMGNLVIAMLDQIMAAYAQNNVELARQAAAQDNEVDALYARIYGQMMESMAETRKQKRVEASFYLLRAAQELERSGDLATNVAERVIYISTGFVQESNIEPDEAIG